MSPPIQVYNPRRLSSWEIPAQRVAAYGHASKPSMAFLPDGQLVMVANFVRKAPDDKRDEWVGLWRSSDGGETWSERIEVKDLIGMESWLTCISDGTLFATSTFTDDDSKNPEGYYHGYVHRSIDGGQTWKRLRIGPEGFPPKAQTRTSRNIVELPDGTLLLGVSVTEMEQGRIAYLWTSQDRGKIWNRSTSRVEIGDYRGQSYDNLDGFFSEDFTFRAQSGKLLHFIRCGPPSPMYPMNDGRLTPSGSAIDRMMRCESTDLGQNWGELRDFGDYGMHYPRVIRLQDGRLLLTFTQRGVFYPIGLQAVLSYDDGETWDFQSDRLIIEGKTGWGIPSGGGFGNTIQLADGTLVSCSTYRCNNDTPLEVIRWRLPAY